MLTVKREDLRTVAQTAILLGYKESYVRNMITQGQLPALKVDKWKTRIHINEIEEILAQRREVKRKHKGNREPKRDEDIGENWEE
jgi:hypothetical protein